MLARNYDNYAWEEQQAERELQQPAPRQVRRTDHRKLARRKLGVIVAIVLSTYLITVIRSEAQVTFGNQLVALQRQETQLITKNNELKIEVEQLKGPDRIIGLAEQRLGMSVARSNIYVQAMPK